MCCPSGVEGGGPGRGRVRRAAHADSRHARRDGGWRCGGWVPLRGCPSPFCQVRGPFHPAWGLGLGGWYGHTRLPLTGACLARARVCVCLVVSSCAPAFRVCPRGVHAAVLSGVRQRAFVGGCLVPFSVLMLLPAKVVSSGPATFCLCSAPWPVLGWRTPGSPDGCVHDLRSGSPAVGGGAHRRSPARQKLGPANGKASLSRLTGRTTRVVEGM